MLLRPLYRLRVRLLLLVLIGTIPALILMGYTAQQLRQKAAADAQADAVRLAEQTAGTQARAIDSTRTLLALLAQLRPVRAYDRPDCPSVLAELLAENPQYQNFGVANPAGELVCSALPPPGPVSLADRSYFQRAQRLRGFAIGDYQIGRVSGKPAINLGHALPAPAGRAPAVVYAALDLTVFDRLFADAKLPPGSTVTLIDEGDTVLARFPDTERYTGEGAELAARLRKQIGGNEGVATAVGPDGVKRLYAVTNLRGGSLRLFVGIPTKVAYAAADRLLGRFLLGLALMTLALLALTWISSGAFVLRGLHALLHAARRIESGDLRARAGVPYHRGELGELARAFDDMAASLGRTSEELRSQQERVARLNRVYAVLSAIGASIIRVRDRDTLFREVCRIANNQGQFPLAWIVTVAPATLAVDRVWCAGNEERPGTVIPFVGENITDRRSALMTALREGKTGTYNDIGKYPCAEEWQHDALEYGYRSCVFLPLQVEGRVFACVGLFAEELGFFDDEELQLLKELSADIAMSLDYQDKAARLDYLAYYDTLTSLPNRSLFRDRLRQAMVAGPRDAPQRPAVLVIALDGLSEINRSYGHRVGDALLREIARRLQPAVRSGDTVARLRNEEFGVLLHGLGGDEDLARATAKLVALFQAPAELEGVAHAFRVRTGSAVYPDDGVDADALVELASARAISAAGG